MRTANALLGAFEVAGLGQGQGVTVNDQTLINRIHAAAMAGNPQAMQLARIVGRSQSGYNPMFQPGAANVGAVRGVAGYGFGTGVSGSPGYGLGRVAGYGVGADPGIGAPAASPLMGGFSPNPNQVQVGWIDPNVTMGAPLGFDSGGTTLVAAGATFSLTSRPQEIFRGERFVIGSDIAPSLVVSDLKVGNRSQLINATNVPGMAFANTTIGASLRFETAQPGQDIVWTGINISGGALRVLGTLFGSSAVRK